MLNRVSIPEARYEFKVHFDGAEFESLTYRVSFGEPDLEDDRGSEFTLSLASKHTTTPGRPPRAGRPNERAGQRRMAPGSGRGELADSFYIDLSLLAKVNGAIKNGAAVDLSAWRPENAKNSFADTTVDFDRPGSLT